MSKHAKKLQRAEDWAGGSFPVFNVEQEHGDVWLFWNYRVAPFTVRVEIPLSGEVDQSPWLYVDGNPYQLNDDAPQSERMTPTSAEARYGAMTGFRLLEEHADEIRKNATTGLARLREAATVVRLFGKREPRRCVIPTWSTHDETAAERLLSG
jgi:hypothetical protein